jgi:hypothetical protein
VRAAAAIGRAVPEQWSVLERVYVDRLLDHLEERHEPAGVDAAVDRFVIALHAALTVPTKVAPMALSSCSTAAQVRR